MVDTILGFAKSKAIVALAGIVFGIVLIIAQAEVLTVLVRALGIVSVAAAIVLVLMYAFGRDKAASQIVISALLAIFGIVLVAAPDALVNLLPTLLGAALVISGGINLVQAYALSQAGSTNWKMGTISSIVVLVLGLLIVFHPGAVADLLVVFMGISLLVGGVCDLLVLFTNRDLL